MLARIDEYSLVLLLLMAMMILMVFLLENREVSFSYFCKASLKMKEPVQTLRILALVTLMNVSMVLLQFERDGL